MFPQKNWNYTEKKINFQNPQPYFNNNVENQSSQYDNSMPFNFNLKASSFCNPSDYHINKQLLYCQDNNIPKMNFPQNNSTNTIEKLFSPNLEKTNSDKRKNKKEIISGENQFVIYLENVR